MRTLVAIAVVALLAGGYYFFIRDVGPEGEPSPTPTEEPLNLQSFEGMGIAFAYPNDYVLEGPTTPTEGLADVTFVLLYDEDDWAELEASTEPREGPPGITVAVYEAAEAADAEAWVRDSPHSNFALDGTPTDARRIGGVEAFGYTSSGLYERTNYAVLRDGQVYLFSVDSIAPAGDPLQSAFETVLSSVSFLSGREDDTPDGGSVQDSIEVQ